MLTRAIGVAACAVGMWAHGSLWWLVAALVIDAGYPRHRR